MNFHQVLTIISTVIFAIVSTKQIKSPRENYAQMQKCRAKKNTCPTVPQANNFDMEEHLGHWYIVETTLDLPDCAFAVRKYPKPYALTTYGDTYYDHYDPHSYAAATYNTHYYVPHVEEQTLLVNYLDKSTNTVKTRYTGKTSKITYSGSSYRNSFTSGSVSDVLVLFADYDPNCGYILMITCTTQANGDFEVNSNILARTPYLDEEYLKKLHTLLTQYGLTETESRLKPNRQQDCEAEPPQISKPSSVVYQRKIAKS